MDLSSILESPDTIRASSSLNTARRRLPMDTSADTGRREHSELSINERPETQASVFLSRTAKHDLGGKLKICENLVDTADDNHKREMQKDIASMIKCITLFLNEEEEIFKKAETLKKEEIFKREEEILEEKERLEARRETNFEDEVHCRVQINNFIDRWSDLRSGDKSLKPNDIMPTPSGTTFDFTTEVQSPTTKKEPSPDFQEITKEEFLSHQTKLAMRGQSRKRSRTDSGNGLEKKSERRKKKTMKGPANGKPADPGAAEVSDTDSVSNAKIHKNEFRVYQVDFESGKNVTQYWTAYGKSRIRHYVLQNIDPPEWGEYRKPVDFNLSLKDVVQGRWNLDALIIHLVMNGRQLSLLDREPIKDIMVAFKRRSTMNRFLKHCGEKFPLTRENANVLKEKWERLESLSLEEGVSTNKDLEIFFAEYEQNYD